VSYLSRLLALRGERRLVPAASREGGCCENGHRAGLGPLFPRERGPLAPPQHGCALPPAGRRNAKTPAIGPKSVCQQTAVWLRATVRTRARALLLEALCTGKSVAYDEIFILRFVDGRIAETWGVVDVFSTMKQIGAIPA
jgi:hypothetical protein